MRTVRDEQRVLHQPARAAAGHADLRGAAPPGRLPHLRHRQDPHGDPRVRFRPDLAGPPRVHGLPGLGRGVRDLWQRHAEDGDSVRLQRVPQAAGQVRRGAGVLPPVALLHGQGARRRPGVRPPRVALGGGAPGDGVRRPASRRMARAARPVAALLPPRGLRGAPQPRRAQPRVPGPVPRSRRRATATRRRAGSPTAAAATGP